MCQRRAPSAAGSVRGGTPSRSCVARPYRRPRPAFARAASRREPLRARTRRTVESGSLTRARQRTPHRAACAGPRPSPTTPRADARTGGDRFAARRENPKRQRRSPRTKHLARTRALSRNAAARAVRSRRRRRALRTRRRTDVEAARSQNHGTQRPLAALERCGKKEALLREESYSRTTTHTAQQHAIFFWEAACQSKRSRQPWVDLPWTQQRHHRSGARPERRSCDTAPSSHITHVRHETAGLSGAHVLDPARPAEGGSYFC